LGELEHSHQSDAEVKKAWSYTSTNCVFIAWCLIKQSNNITFTEDN